MWWDSQYSPLGSSSVLSTAAATDSILFSVDAARTTVETAARLLILDPRCFLSAVGAGERSWDVRAEPRAAMVLL